jgi:hypothetical protein
LLTVSDAIGPDKKERIEDSVLKGAVDGVVGLALDTLQALH